MNTKVLVGPPIPKHIQALRDKRRKDILNAIKKLQEKATFKVDDKPNVTSDSVSNSDSSSDEDGIFGPQLPVATAPTAEDEEKMALERLKERSVNTALSSKEDSESTKDPGDRSTWMDFALGHGKEEEITYDPKTFRRRVNKPRNKTNNFFAKESAAEKSKRLADEMMGIHQNENISQKRQKQDDNSSRDTQDVFDYRKNEPSLLEQHLEKRKKEKIEKSKKKLNKNHHKGHNDEDDRDRFVWNRDMKSTTITSSKIQEVVNQAKDMQSRFARGSK